MEKSFWNEEWKYIVNDKIIDSGKFQISNYGRVKSFKVDKEQGRLIKPVNIGGYPALTPKTVNGKKTTLSIHRLVATYFLPNNDPQKNMVIHKDHNKTNNHVSNLMWASEKEKSEHQKESPAWKEASKKARAAKLTEAQVRLIKKKINDPNRKTRLKLIAKQFGISEMQLYRIKSGENWGHVKVDD